MKGEKITIASQNVRCLGQGFTGNRKRREIKDLYKRTTPQTDILLLQETKLPEAACLRQARFIEFKKGSSLWNEGSFSARTARFKGGTGIVLSERMAGIITSHGVLYPGRAQYITIQLSPTLYLGVLNVYGFSHTGPRAMLWDHLAQAELPAAYWILGGDFNNIEQASDKQGGSHKTSIGRRELEAWNRLLMKLGGRDAHHTGSFVRRSNKSFTWANTHTDENMIQTRIDRFYIPIHIENIGGTTEILPTLPNISDHAGVVIHFNNEPRRRTPPPPFNKGLLANQECKAALLATWREAMDTETLETWNQKVVHANQAIRLKSAELTKSQKIKWKETYQAQFAEIIAAEDELQHNWGSVEARDKLSEAQIKLHEVRQQKFQFQESAILSKWSRVGDRCTKEFFEHHAGTRKPAPIIHMMDGDRPINTQAALEEHILNFYKQLYQRDDQVENNSAAREDCFQFLRPTVTEEHNLELLKPLTQEEVKEALKQLPAGKAPGIDAIPAEFYQEMWDDIEFDIFNFVSESISQAHISDELNISKIALLPKSEDRSRIQNFRPISLLNTLYKVIAKVYANRMKPMLHHWILPSQTGFVPNRCILDNIFLAFESIVWSLENNQALSMLLLDFEKAYDRVSWVFLQHTMVRMGFAETWVQRVMSLNLNASAAIIVNGEQSQTFKLERSVRQGCPLAPYLFLLTVDVLGQMLQHPGNDVKGLRLPDDSTITNQMFADDTLLLLDGTPDNLNKAIEVIKRFGAASGAKLNLHKSIGVWVSHTPRTWNWGEDEGLKWLMPGEVTKYLGYPFGINITQQEKDNKMLNQVRKHLHRWACNKLSLAGRIMVSNQVILSSIWYFASCMDFSNHALKLVRATVRNYIWSGRTGTNARARVKWATAVLPIVRGGVKILDPQWQSSALLVKLLMRGMSIGYEPWKTLIRHRVANTRQTRGGRWPTHANWIMNNHKIAIQGSSMWQGVMKAWNSIQSGIEQQAPSNWTEIMRQPLFGNRLLTNEMGIQWGTEPGSLMWKWAAKDFQALKDILRHDGYGWKSFPELLRLRRNQVTSQIYARVRNSIPWDASPPPPHTPGQWLASQEEDGQIQFVYHLQQINPPEALLYKKEKSEQLTLLGSKQRPPPETKEVRIIRTLGSKNAILDFNPVDDTPEGQSLWLWGKSAVIDLQWDPKDWSWRRIGILPDTSVLNYTTKRGYRVALRQDNNQMQVDAEMEAAGVNSKTRAKFFNRIWHPYLPRKVSAMQWLILNEGLPVGAWREKVGLDGSCQVCTSRDRETLQHSFLECCEVRQAWTCFRRTRQAAGLPASYITWKDISRGLMMDPAGPSVEADLQWDTASSVTINMETPWDILRAQLLWGIWCQRVALAFEEEQFHLGRALWQAWKNTIYCAMEAYKELHRHKRNEEKRQQMISCFQKIWTANNIFGTLDGTRIKWKLTPHEEFLPQALGAWNATPIRINRLSPSPDPEAEFTAQENFQDQIQSFLDDIGNNWQPPEAARHTQEEAPDESPETAAHTVLATPPPMPSESADAEPPRHPLGNCTQSPNPPRQVHGPLLGDENEDPHPNLPGEREVQHPHSRPKTKCRYGPLRRKNILGPSPLPNSHSYESPEHAQTRIETNTEQEATEAEPYQLDRPRSRPKTKCRFGPMRKPGTAPLPVASSSCSTEPPQIGSGLPNSPHLHVADVPPHMEGLLPLFPQPDRVTLLPPMERSRSVFARYYNAPEEAPRPSSIPTVARRLNMSTEALEAQVALEAAEFLRSVKAERRMERLFSAPPDLQRPLSKQDCLDIFNATGIPPTGSLYGVYLWAADLGHAKYNFVREEEGYEFLNAYD
jgi:exonuclease III